MSGSAGTGLCLAETTTPGGFLSFPRLPPFLSQDREPLELSWEHSPSV